MMFSLPQPLKDAGNDLRTFFPRYFRPDSIHSVEVSSVYLGNVHSCQIGEVREQTMPIFFGDVHAMDIHENSDHDCNRLLSGAALVAIAKFHMATQSLRAVLTFDTNHVILHEDGG